MAGESQMIWLPVKTVDGDPTHLMIHLLEVSILGYGAFTA